MRCVLEIDRRMVDYCVALDIEFGALVEGSSLYTPNVTLDQVVLASTTKQLILDTISGMKKFRKLIVKLGFGASTSAQTTNYVGNGIVILFHGISGTGKTMMANAIANHLQRKVLLVNYTRLFGANGGNSRDSDCEELLLLAFREAKIQNAIVFFDECEALFESRDLRGNRSVNLVLNAIEKYDDLMILATNRPFDLDEAMYRRIQLAVEFPAPDVHLRQEIWRTHIPAQVKLADDVDLYSLSTEFELTGGFIRNAVLTALKNSMLKMQTMEDSKDDDEYLLFLCQKDLRKACRQQLIGQLQLCGFNRRVIPEKCLADLVLDEDVLCTVNDIITKHKASKVLSGQWGFKEQRTCVLICGPNGVGKSTIAEVIAYECGKPMKTLTCSELLHLHRLTFSISHRSESQLKSDSVFGDLNSGAVLVIEGCEILFDTRGASSAYDQVIGFLLFQMRRKSVSNMVIFVMQSEMQSGHVLSMSNVQKTFLKQFNFILKMRNPNKSLRQKLWKHMIPNETPMMDDCCEEDMFGVLSERYPKFVHSDIHRCIVKACTIACLRKNVSDRCLKKSDLIIAAKEMEEQMESDGLRLGFHHMYS